MAKENGKRNTAGQITDRKRREHGHHKCGERIIHGEEGVKGRKMEKKAARESKVRKI